MEVKVRQITEVVRFITENHDYIIEGNWFCQHWRCKHEPKKCQDEEACRNRCPHEPECETEKECRTKWVCKHKPTCVIRGQCQRRWSCRHKPMCQNKGFCRKNWKCNHPSQCKDVWECKYRWTEEYEPRCQDRWQCHHRQICQNKIQCQNKPFRYDEWMCPHETKCYNKWRCQNIWQCQHKEKCARKGKCKVNCQHQCKNKEECLKKLFQYGNEWKCRHQCENIVECHKKWKCPHESEFERKCDNEWMCRSRGWACQHSPPCLKRCQGKWDRENEWNCKHKPKCRSSWQCINDPQYQNKWQCQNRWKIGYSQDELKAILKKPHQQLYDFFTQWCGKCKKNCTISSFLLYDRSKNLESEVICHLVWVKAKKVKGDVFYRVFGKWECYKEHTWDSSYTWISLRKFVENSQHGFSKHDFWKIKCHKCQQDGHILNWKSIVGSMDGPLHERELCEKCQSGEMCVQTNSYFG